MYSFFVQFVLYNEIGNDQIIAHYMRQLILIYTKLKHFNHKLEIAGLNNEK